MDINDVDFFPEDEDFYGGQEGGHYVDDDSNEETLEHQTQQQENNPGGQPGEQSGGQQGEQKDLVLEFLKFQGINDPEKIKFEDEDGILKERSWADLSFEEQMNILTTSHQEPERDLDDEEIQLLNDIRSRRMSPSQYLDVIRQQAAQDYADNLNANPQYDVEDLTDDEVFLLDLQDKIADITDDELHAALDAAKANPSLFAKQVAGLRETLKAQQETYNQQMAVEAEAVQQEQFNQFRDAVVNSIQSFNKVGDLDVNLDTNDASELASFILDKDDTGMSYMGKALNDPRTLVEMAWWTLKGRQVLTDIQDYFAGQIKQARQQSYQKGLEEGRKGAPSRVVQKPQFKPQGRGGQGGMTIDDIWG